MGKVQIVSLMLITSLILLVADANSTLSKKREKLTVFRVYVHDVLGGPNPTVFEVARANITATSPTMFGQVVVADDLMTVGPDPNSQELGRVQGLSAQTSLDQMAITITGVFIFTSGEYNGSTISIMGWKVATGVNQEIPIVGGTGDFRLARGYTVSNLYSQDPATNTFLFTYDIYVYLKKESGC